MGSQQCVFIVVISVYRRPHVHNVGEPRLGHVLSLIRQRIQIPSTMLIEWSYMDVRVWALIFLVWICLTVSMLFRLWAPSEASRSASNRQRDANAEKVKRKRRVKAAQACRSNSPDVDSTRPAGSHPLAPREGKKKKGDDGTEQQGSGTPVSVADDRSGCKRKRKSKRKENGDETLTPRPVQKVEVKTVGEEEQGESGFDCISNSLDVLIVEMIPTIDNAYV